MTRNRLFLIALVAIGVAGAVVYARVVGRSNTLEGSGTVEARNIRVGSKIGGRIEQVLVREGDEVQAGQTLVTFEDQELRAALEEARANLAKMERGYRSEEIAEARAAAAQAKAEYEEKQRGYRTEEVSAARAELDRTRAEAVRAELNFKRLDGLAKKEIISRQQRDDAEAAWKMAVAAQQNAEQKLAELERGYRPEQVRAAEARYSQAEAARLRMERGNRSEDIEFSRAALREAEAKYRERNVLAPSAAVVEVLDARPGDLIAPNTPIATLLERDQIYVRIYVPETKIGLVRVGQSAEVRVDSFPGQVFAAVIEHINQNAEFLPRNVQTKEERIHQVFGVKLRIEDPSRRVRAGMAADVKLKSREG